MKLNKTKRRSNNRSKLLTRDRETLREDIILITTAKWDFWVRAHSAKVSPRIPHTPKTPDLTLT